MAEAIDETSTAPSARSIMWFSNRWAMVVRAGMKPVSRSESLASVTSWARRTVTDESAAVTSQKADDAATTSRPTAGIRNAFTHAGVVESYQTDACNSVKN